MHLRMWAVIAENVTDSASAVAELTRPSSHRHFLRASWATHTSCSFCMPFDTSSLPIKTGTITAQTFLPGNGAIFVSEIKAVMHPALYSRAVRLETRQMPILALLPLWIADAFTYWKLNVNFVSATALVSIEKKAALNEKTKQSDLSYQLSVVNLERFHRKHWKWSKTSISDNPIKYTLNISPQNYFCFLSASSFGSKISPCKLHPALLYKLLRVNFVKKTQILFWPHLEIHPLVKWGQSSTPQPVSGVIFFFFCKRKGYLTFIWNISTRLFYQFLYNICEVLSS